MESSKIRPKREPVPTAIKVLLGFMVGGLVCAIALVVWLLNSGYVKVIGQLSSGQQFDSKR